MHNLQTAIRYSRNGRWHEAKNLTDPNINKLELDILYSIRTELTASKADDLHLKATRIIITNISAKVCYQFDS